MKKNILLSLLMLIAVQTFSQSVSKTMKHLPDTGQTISYTSSFGEDNDYTIYFPYFTINGNGTVTDTITRLMSPTVE